MTMRWFDYLQITINAAVTIALFLQWQFNCNVLKIFKDQNRVSRKSDDA
jgi:hypothetical protein